MTTKCQVCKKWGSKAAEFWEELSNPPLTLDLVMKAREMGPDRPDFIGLIAGIENYHVPESFRTQALRDAEFDLQEDEP